MEYNRITLAVITKLQAIVGEKYVWTDEEKRIPYGRDEGTFTVPLLPDVVVLPETAEELAAVVALANEAVIPVIPRGTGTGLEGGALVDGRGGILVSTERMNRILEINEEAMYMVVEAGVITETIQKEAGKRGLLYAGDPCSGDSCCIGGNGATNAGGNRAVKYGTTRDQIYALEVVTPTGKIAQLGKRLHKMTAGYPLEKIVVGSEGTLGIITELTLRLHGQPEDVAAAVCGFATLDEAVECVTATIQSGIPMARIEFVDGDAARAFNQYAGTHLHEGPHLMVEFHGSPVTVREDAQRFGELAAEFGGTGFDWATTPEERAALWKMRHGAYRACLALRPGATAVVTDACVPMSHLPAAVAAAAADIREAGLIGPMVGHVGDGNFHSQMLIMPGNADELAAAKRVATRMAERALAVGGTITGEHGVGIGKRSLMRAQHGDAIGVMAAIKTALDPQGIMNPGKMLPDVN